MAGTTTLRSGFTYVYLAVLFALLSGFFHPFISGSTLVVVVVGIVTLFAGLGGGILLYKSVAAEKKRYLHVAIQESLLSEQGPSRGRRGVLLACGFVLVGISLIYIYQLTGRL